MYDCRIQEVPWATQQCSRAAAMIDSRSGTELAIDGGEEAGRLQTRLEEAERLVRRLRAETDEQRREVLAPAICPQRVTSQGVTNLLFESSPAPIAARYVRVRARYSTRIPNIFCIALININSNNKNGMLHMPTLKKTKQFLFETCMNRKVRKDSRSITMVNE